MEKFKISLIDLKKEYTFLKKEIKKQINDCLKTHHWILGEKTKEFEEKVAKYLGVKYVIGVASGTDALLLSLRALAIKIKKKEFFEKKDEIITTPLTFIATSEAIKRSGATAVFVDVDPLTFNIDPKQIKKAITKNTVGILVVHLYGLPCFMDQILKSAKENNLFVVEDCAQSFGAEYKGKKVGSWADFGAFSFFPSKNLGAYGDAGLITTNDAKLNELVRILRNHGQRKQYNAQILGYNSRLDNFQAAILLAKLKYVNEFNKKRREIAYRYSRALKSIKSIQVPFEPKDAYHVYHLYTIKLSSKRNQLLNYLNKKGIQARIYYPISLDKMKPFKSSKTLNFKNTPKILPSILSLPIHPFLKENEVKYVVKEIKNFYHF